MFPFYCGALPIVHNVDQLRILFYKKLKCHSSVLLKVLAKICHREILSIANKYNINCLDVSVGQVRRCVWDAFADSVMQSFYSFVYCVILVFLSVLHRPTCVLFILCAASVCNKNAQIRVAYTFYSEFETCASIVLDGLCENDQNKSYELLTGELRTWREQNLFSLAEDVGQGDFVNNKCCQTKLDKIWLGKTTQSTSVFTVCFLPVFA